MSLSSRHQHFSGRLNRASHRSPQVPTPLGRPRNPKANQQSNPSTQNGFGLLSPKLPINHSELPTEYQKQCFLSLPKGFCYSVVSYAGETMCDGNRVPTNHGSMAAFRGGQGTTVVLRNHDLSNETTKVKVKNGNCYDAKRSGGTSTIVFNRRGRLCMHHGSLAGTDSNQAGGPTPWDTWLSCEGKFSAGSERHGYVFEIPSDGFAEAQPIRDMGRFAHGGVAVDPNSGFVYMTENRSDGLLYRFRPKRFGELYAGGTLEALRIIPPPSRQISFSNPMVNLLIPQRSVWVSIREADPISEYGRQSTRSQGHHNGALIINQGRGPWYHQGRIYFTSCSNGANNQSLIWSFDPHKETIIQWSASNTLTTTHPLLLGEPQEDSRSSFCELAFGPTGRIYRTVTTPGQSRIVAINNTGETFDVAVNQFNRCAFAGLCFSPSHRFMFINIANPGITFVVRGPWRQSLVRSPIVISYRENSRVGPVLATG